ncbi:MAG: peptide deformylase [Thermoanaerobaculia bacterium]|jgi:peptide deformylase|nr:peptide deformylase [Thermoanaerobaculia bacterium]MBP9826359.1 peptide deformylase [Thermoanaerobaculia bacterium]
MTLRPILLFPDPILRKKTEEVQAFDSSLDRLVAEMSEAMYAAPGVGLAAPQIGDLRRVALVDVDPSGPKSLLHVLVNPRIVARAGAETDIEGCLSIPGFTERVERPLAVRVAAQRLSGEAFELEAEGFFARVLCHEIDHLEGILFIDHLRGLRRQLAMRKLGKLGYAREQLA